MRNGARLLTIAISELERAGYEVTHTTNPLRFTIERLAKDIDRDQLCDLAEEHGVPITVPSLLGYHLSIS